MVMVGLGAKSLRRTAFARLSIGLLFCVVPVSPTLASDHTPTSSHHKGEHRHHLSFLIGGTSVLQASHTGFTYGIDYEYVLTSRLGVGLIVERAEGDVDATSLFAVADIHVTDALVVQVGPGIEFEGGEEIAVGRFGAYYEFDAGPITISPTVSYDVSEKDDAIIFGILIGRKF